jgi:hypothetical protein
MTIKTTKNSATQISKIAIIFAFLFLFAPIITNIVLGAEPVDDRSIYLNALDAIGKNKPSKIPDMTIPKEQKPSPISVIWSCDSKVPFDYYGRSLPTLGSKIEVVALVNNQQTIPANYNFEWKLDGQTSLSGPYSVFEFNASNSVTKTYLVQLTIKDEKTTVFSKSISIKTIKPQAFIYAKANPYLPQSEQTLHSDQSVWLEAKPYFFTTKNASDLKYIWIINGKERQTLTLYVINQKISQQSAENYANIILSPK